MQRVDDNIARLHAALRAQLATQDRKRRQLEDRVRSFDLMTEAGTEQERLNVSSFRAATLVRARLERQRRRVENAAAKLGQLNPRLVLTRGYAIVLDESGAIVRGAAGTSAGAEIRLLFAEDAVKARVIESPST